MAKHTSPSEKLALAVLVVLLGASAYLLFRDKSSVLPGILPEQGEGTACTADAKICPDGSAVGRIPPSCEFAACPSQTPGGDTTKRAVIEGTVLLGPTCPVERYPADPSCAPRPYSTSVEVRRTSDGALIAGVTTDAEGRFSTAVPPGVYLLQALGGTPYPSCSEETVTVSAGMTHSISLTCDTGIR